MTDGYILEEDKIKIEETGKEYDLRPPLFRDRKKILNMFFKTGTTQKYQDAISKISNMRGMKKEQVIELITNGELTDEESEIINQASSDSLDMLADDMAEDVIVSVLNYDDQKKEEIMSKMGFNEGLTMFRGCMDYLMKKIKLTKDERKK